MKVSGRYICVNIQEWRIRKQSQLVNYGQIDGNFGLASSNKKIAHKCHQNKIEMHVFNIPAAAVMAASSAECLECASDGCTFGPRSIISKASLCRGWVGRVVTHCATVSDTGVTNRSLLIRFELNTCCCIACALLIAREKRTTSEWFRLGCVCVLG